MDRRTDKSNLNTALCTSASRGKKVRGIRGFEIWYLPLERQHVRMLGVSSQPISVSRSMLSTSARPASTIFVVFIDTSDVHSVAGLLWHWFMPLAPKTVTNKLQRVLNAAARVVRGSRKFDRGLTQLIHTELHWLDVPEPVKYKLGMITRRCLNSRPTAILLLSIWLLTAFQCLRLHQDNICVLLPVISLQYRSIDWVLMDVGLSLLLVRRRETLYRDICVILFTQTLSLHVYWRRSLFRLLVYTVH